MHGKRKSTSRRRMPVNSGEPRVYLLGSSPMGNRLLATLSEPFADVAREVESLADLLLDLSLEPLPVDLMLIDRRLDDEDGLALIQRLREEPACRSVVLLKAVAGEGEGELSIAFFGYVPQPTQIGSFDVGIAG